MALGRTASGMGLRARTEDVQPVAHRHLGEVAQMRVEGGERVRHRRVAVDTGGGQQPRILGPLQDPARDQVGAARVEHRRGGIFLHQFAQGGGRRVEAGFRGLRRQVADRDRADPALGRRRLAGIVDDERVDHRQGADGQSRQQAGESATALPGSHSVVPWVPRWISASLPSRKARWKAREAWHGTASGS